MLVIAKPGTKCPKEGKPKEYIDNKKAVNVPSSAYYTRLVTDGSLVVVKEPKPVHGSLSSAVSTVQSDSKSIKKGGKK